METSPDCHSTFMLKHRYSSFCAINSFSLPICAISREKVENWPGEVTNQDHSQQPIQTCGQEPQDPTQEAAIVDLAYSREKGLVRRIHG